MTASEEDRLLVYIFERDGEGRVVLLIDKRKIKGARKLWKDRSISWPAWEDFCKLTVLSDRTSFAKDCGIGGGTMVSRCPVSRGTL